MAASSVAQLLSAMRELLEEETFAALAAFVRHPDVERHLLRSLAGNRLERWLGVMDEYATKRLPTAVSMQSEPADPADANSVLGEVLKAVRRLLAPLTKAKPHPNDLLAVMRRVYTGNSVGREDPAAAETIRACEAIQNAVARAAALPADWHPESGAALIRLVMDVCGKSPLPSDSAADSLELLGWLELPLDPTPVAIITGVNDGMLPESYGADALLPDGMRAKLGIACSDTRLARDTFLLSLVVHSRRSVTLISGRKNADGDPLPPSRLLFAADSERVVERVRRLCAKERPGPRVRVLEPVAGMDRFVHPPRVVCADVESMAVTAFGPYLASPYLFYLKNVLCLEEFERPEPEMDPLRFGDLIHKALERFGTSDARDSADKGEVRKCLLDHLSTLGAEWFGAGPALAVRVQLEMARARLEEVAAWQADRRAAGWRIVRTEWKPGGGVELPGMDRPFRIRGKIDRIDQHDELGVAILDYKTGETVKPPKQSHGKPGKWKDLQLPLYRHLAAGLGLPLEKLILGYVAVPSRPGGVRVLPADWTDAELADADAKAREIATRVRNGDFFELGAKPPDEGTLAAIAGTALVAARHHGEAVDDE